MTYAKAPPIEAAPASPIMLLERYNAVNVLFSLQIIQKRLDNATLSIQKIINYNYQSKKIGWRQRNVFIIESSFTRENVTYAKAPPIEAAPAAPIWLLPRSRRCNVLFTLQIRHKHTLINAHDQSIQKIGWRQRNGFMNESSFTR